MPTLDWIGKKAVENHHNEIPFRLLKSIPELSVGDPNSGNLIIQGDNLHALKALLPYYAGQVKCICIDPPYNTGNEGWVYNDNVNSPEMKAWLNKVVGKEGEDLSRHDKWLCMMYPRLELLRKFLREDGILFVNIDDYELNNLLNLLDEIFGKNNQIATLPTIMNLKGNQDQFGFAGTHEYIVVYAKNKNRVNIKEFPIQEEEMEKWDTDDIGFYKKGAPLRATGEESLREDRPLMFYPILIKDNIVSTIDDDEFSSLYDNTNNNFDDKILSEIITKYKNLGFDVILPIEDIKNNRYGRWRWGFSKKNRELLKSDVIITRTKNGISLNKKQRPELNDLPTKKPKTLFYKPEYSSGNGTAQIKRIFGSKVFDNPKPIDLIYDLIQISTENNDIILDSFAGSATTGHAVLQLNQDENSTRQFVLIEMDENICKEITKERLKRVIQGYSYSKSNATKINVDGLEGGFSYCQLDEQLFDENGNINSKIKYKELAGHIFFSETGIPMSVEQNESFPQIGIYKGTAYYLLYNGILGDKTVNGGNIITKKTLELLPKFDGLKIVFAEGTRINPLKLRKENIIFKQTHYEIKVS